MQKEYKCALAVCRCRADAENAYCSEYCRQAADQGTEREFCQCGHASCRRSLDRLESPKIPDSIHLTPGRIVVEYQNLEHLRGQLLLLLHAVDQNVDVLQTRVDSSSERQWSTDSELRSASAKAGGI